VKLYTLDGGFVKRRTLDGDAATKGEFVKLYTLDGEVLKLRILDEVRQHWPDAFIMEREQLRWAVCSQNRVTKELDELAESVAIIEVFKSRAPEDRDLDWFPLLEVQRIIENVIDGNQSYVLRRFADALDEYNSGFANRNQQERVIIHLLIAGRELYMERAGSPFSKAALKERTRALWEHTCARVGMREGFPEVNWPRLYKIVGLNEKIVKDAPRGRKPRNCRQKL